GVLQNAEREDTFRVLAVSNRLVAVPEVAADAVAGVAAPGGTAGAGVAPGTSVTAFGEAVTPEGVAAAVAALPRTQLVGALDLGRAFRSAEDYAAGCNNPYVVHVGGGYTGMGTPTDELPKLLSPRTHYVGVGVGKRWNRALMKRCAERTGGYYTQI